MMIGVANGLGAVCGVAVGQSVGAGDLESVKRVAGTSLSFVTGLALLVTAAGIALAPNIISGMGTPEPAVGIGSNKFPGEGHCYRLPARQAPRC